MPALPGLGSPVRLETRHGGMDAAAVGLVSAIDSF